MLKDIVVALPQDFEENDATRSTADYALALAAEVEAHITAVIFEFDPVMPPAIMGGIPLEYINEQRLQNEQTAGRTLQRFEKKVRAASLPFSTLTLETSYAEAGKGFARLARPFDLAIVSQPSQETSGIDEMLIEGVLFQSGRPALIIPHGHIAAPAFSSIIVAWDGSEQAARAMHESLPLLRRAGRIQVLSLSKGQDLDAELNAADIAHHLARHGLKAEARHRAVPDGDIAKALIDDCVDFSADLLVMGGYGHSRLRQFIWGGTTSGILSRMTVPVLMSH